MRIFLPVITLFLAGCITLKNDLPFLNSLAEEEEVEEVAEVKCPVCPIGKIYWHLNQPIYKKPTPKKAQCECRCGD